MAYDYMNITEGQRINSSFLLVNQDEHFEDLESDGLMGLTNNKQRKTLVDELYEAGYIKVKILIQKMLIIISQRKIFLHSHLITIKTGIQALRMGHTLQLAIFLLNMSMRWSGCLYLGRVTG